MVSTKKKIAVFRGIVQRRLDDADCPNIEDFDGIAWLEIAGVCESSLESLQKRATHCVEGWAEDHECEMSSSPEYRLLVLGGEFRIDLQEETAWHASLLRPIQKKKAKPKKKAARVVPRHAILGRGD